MTNSYFIGQPRGPLFPEENSSIFGYKTVLVKWNEGKPFLVPPHYHTKTSQLTDESKCHRDHKDADSFEGCSCGFYAYHTVAGAVNHLSQFNFSGNVFLVEAAFSGLVIDAEKGLRATKQRVRQITVPPCWSCAAEANALVEHESGYLVASCSACAARDKLKLIGFEEFQEKTKQDEFNPISLLPLENNALKTFAAVFQQADARRALSEAIKTLVDAGDIGPLITMKFELDELLAKLTAEEN